jgi:Flp pilus assembly protein TadD
MKRGGEGPHRLHARGVALLLTGEPNRALSLLEEATREDPANADLWNVLAVGRIASGKVGNRREFLSAIAAADRAAVLAPRSGAPLFNRGLALEALGRRVEAVRDYRRAAELEPDSSWSEETKARISMIEE